MLDLEKLEKLLDNSLAKETNETLSNWLNKEREQTCLHNGCPQCKGTGRKEDGTICVHYISCPCKKCSPTYYNVDLY